MASTATHPAEIRADTAYALPDFMARTKLGWKSIRRARREGLRVTKIGNRSYVRGSDWLEHLATVANK